MESALGFGLAAETVRRAWKDQPANGLGYVLQPGRAAGSDAVQRRAAVRREHHSIESDVQYAVPGAGRDGESEPVQRYLASCQGRGRRLVPVPADSAVWRIRP